MTDQQPGLFIRGIGLLALAGAGLSLVFLWKRSSRQFNKGRSEPEKPKIPEVERRQIDFVKTQISEHREDYLTYFARMQCIREGLPNSEIDRVLVGRKPMLGSPTLLLESPEFIWRRGQLNQAVNTVIEELGLPTTPTASDPTIRASEACRAWAQAEAPSFVRNKSQY
jgi:hypothetical protein